MLFRALLCSLIAGCGCEPSGESLPPPDSDDSPGDSVDDTAPPFGSFLVLPSVPEGTQLEGEAMLSLVHVSFGDGPAIGRTVASATLALEGVRMDLPWPPPEDDAVDLGGSGGISGALYALVAHRDEDGDGAWGEGERVLGIAMDRWLLFVHSIEDDHGHCVVNTWREVDLGIAGQYEPNRCALDTTWPLEWMTDQGYPVYFQPYDDPIELPLRGLEAGLELEGSVVDQPEEPLRLAALPYPHFTERSVEPGFDLALEQGGERFTASLSEEPPVEDDVGSDPDWRYTMHLLLPYADADTSGAWSDGDELEGASTCLEGELAWARYTRAVSSYRGYRFLDCYSGTVGWRVAHYGDSGGVEYLGSEQARRLMLDFPGCRLD
jgi:hypothetical protein